MASNRDFDFAVRTPEPVITLSPGQASSVPVAVQAVRGQPQPVNLIVATNWGGAGIAAQVTPGIVTPPSGAATLHIVVSAATPPGSYMIGVQGSIQGTFRTSEAMVTVVVKPPEQKQGKEQNTADSAPTPKPAQVLKSTPAPGQLRTKPQRTARPGAIRQLGGFLTAIVVLGVVGYMLYYLDTQYDILGIFNSSPPAETASYSVGAYEGTQTFTIYSALTGKPDSATGAASVQIDSDGNVLGPVLFGKINNGVFTGEARTKDGTVFPMNGNFSNGVLSAQYKSNSVSWVWTLRKK